MKCPYCDGEMEKGLIQSPHEIGWIPGGYRQILGRAEFHGGVVLSELSIFKGSAVTAWLCRGCEKVIIDYAGGKADLNR